MKKEPTYKEALSRVEQIVAEIEKGDTDLDLLAARLREARDLLAVCRARLMKAEAEVNEILQEDDGTR